MSTYSPETSPRAPSPVTFRKNRKTDRSSYIQRWKVLQDRNRNLPKIDFGVKAQIVPKRQNKSVGIGARSLTLDSLKLPSLCTASSVITTSTNASGSVAPKSDVVANTKKTVGIQVTIHFTRWKYGETQVKDKEKDLSSSLSRSLPNIATAVQNDSKTSSKHRFERISYSKKLQTRSVEKKEKDEESTTQPQQELQELEKSDS
ncbi:uncharacterized protein LOC133183778 isoform X1 [Saccostrea echinata]|uniref:uncharacterized protein LOC133183778 isoform X1 n=1 Tax=Saccostrea echinata TaxID=191078 RepID=UPI002A8182C5|nr:uncharacterized protein LOC133183778 isoform X1 [Saccostrea echinata]